VKTLLAIVAALCLGACSRSELPPPTQAPPPTNKASPFRVRAWREAAHSIRDHDRELSDVFRDHGRAGLEAVPYVGARLAAVIIELIKTGTCGALERLQGEYPDPIERDVSGDGRAVSTTTRHGPRTMVRRGRHGHSVLCGDSSSRT
jgi:Helix-hairpin-helix domain